MPDLVVGSIPRGEDYFGREDFIETLWKRLDKDNVLLVAPRRFGKTGAMYRLLDEPREPFKPLYVNVEDISTAADFMVELLAALLRDRRFSRVLRELWQGAKGLGSFLRDLPSSLDVGGLKIELRERAAAGETWVAFGEQVMELLVRDEPRLLVLIDEFAIMASSMDRQQGRAELARFLRWFRSARLAPETRTRFVLGSSINLLNTLGGMGLVDTVNDLSIERLKPFSPEIAERFVEQIFAGRDVALAPEVRDAILELMGTAIPYLLSVFLTAIFDRHRAARMDISVELVHATFNEDVLGGATAATFHHYRSRLDEHYSKPEAQAARAILGGLSRSQKGVEQGTLYQHYLKSVGRSAEAERAEAFLQLMSKLENDFYIVRHEGRFTFYSRVLGAWWKARYGFLGE
ncbi:MAG: hypothetical protein GY856_05125 [bacterium]|nr:hypothetical protein [bacterium]